MIKEANLLTNLLLPIKKSQLKLNKKRKKNKKLNKLKKRKITVNHVLSIAKLAITLLTFIFKDKPTQKQNMMIKLKCYHHKFKIKIKMGIKLPKEV